MPVTDSKKRKEYLKEWKRKNRDKVHAQKRRARDRKRGGPPRTVNPYGTNGWDKAMFQATLREQGDRCAICRQPMKVACADHKHSYPPLPRGVLCNGCNSAIGFLKESPAICRAAADYLEVWSQNETTV